MKLKKLKIDKSSEETSKAEIAEVQKSKTEKVDGQVEEKNDRTEDHEKKTKTEALTSLIQYFKELTKDKDNLRIHAVLQLLQQLTKTKDHEKRSIEVNYSLKRLIRGCGASTHASRTGFFIGLVAFLRVFSEADISFEQIMHCIEKELHVGTTITCKEDADAVVGRILVCGALIHADRLEKADSIRLEKVTVLLLECSKYRTYHLSLAFFFLLELLEKLTESQFETIVWPLLQKKLSKPWPKQSLQTVHCLIVIQKKFPKSVTAKFFKNHFGGSELLNPNGFNFLYKIFWQNSDSYVLTHPAFEVFGTYLAGSSELTRFWLETVETALEKPTKLQEIETIKILTDILNNLNNEKTKLVDLLSPNFIRMLMEGVRNLKQTKETTKAFYDEFFQALLACCAKETITDDLRVKVIRKLLSPPGIINIEKYCGTRIVHQLINNLGMAGVLELVDFYKNIFLSTIIKNPENTEDIWLNFERQNAGYMLQHLLMHKSVTQAHKWREEQLKFFLKCGIFYVDDNTFDICKKDTSGKFSKDFGEQCKNMFYSSLKRKIMDLRQECELLLSLINFCNKYIQKKHASKYFRVKYFDAETQEAWSSMYEAIGKSVNANDDGIVQKTQKQIDLKHANDKLQILFQILLSSMGLQLFREPEMARAAIEDLLKCMEHAKQRQKQRKREHKNVTDENAEPEWIEVVVDIFLQLLSHDAGDLRNIVNALFPHLCENLSLSAVHQILAMLDMKNNQNPLSLKGDNDGDDDDNEGDDGNDLESIQRTENDNKKGSDNREDEDEKDVDDDDDDDDDEEEDDDDDDDDEEEEEEEMEEKITESDKLRNAVSEALIATGAAALPGDHDNNDDDMHSVDLNDITEEDGKKLDEALANAFKALKKSSNDTSGKVKKTKSLRIETTSLMHFRIRVLGLIEIYIQHKPSFLHASEIMLALYEMLEFCLAEELKPLQIKVEKVLTKLTGLKYDAHDDELKDYDNLVEFIRIIFQRKVSHDFTNKLRNKCIVFLISHLDKFSNSLRGETETDNVLKFFQNAIDEYISSRNPTITGSLLSEIFKLRWSGIWTLAINLARLGINIQTRIFRRIQIFEILTILYKNFELLKKIEMEILQKHFRKIEKHIEKHTKSLVNANESTKLSAREFQTSLEFILSVRQAYERLNLDVSTSRILSSDACVLLQSLRKKIKLDSTNIYRRFCEKFSLEFIKNSDANERSAIKQNSDPSNNKDHVSNDENHNAVQHNDAQRHNDDAGAQLDENFMMESDAKGMKRKKENKDFRKAKKMKKQLRMEAFSKGFTNDSNL